MVMRGVKKNITGIIIILSDWYTWSKYVENSKRRR